MKRLLMLALLIATPAVAQNKKISELPDGSPGQAGDMIPIARASCPGGNCRLPFSAWGVEGALPALRRSTVIVPQVSVATLHTAPYTIADGVQGKMLLPEYVHVAKPDGTAWTATGCGLLTVAWPTALTSGPMAIFNEASTIAFFSAAQNYWISKQAPYGYWSGAPASGDPIVLYLSAADISGGTGDLTVNVWYREWGLTHP